MPRSSRPGAWFGAVAALAACHLADDPEPPHCGPGYHVDTGRCVADRVAGTVVVLSSADGGECAPRPETVTIAADGSFQFRNDDDVDREVKGSDGQVWAVVKAHAYSDFIGISKIGSWAYTVSGCSKGGVVIVR